MMERYFGQQREEKLKQARPDLYYQVGVTPNDVEKPVALMDPSVKELIGQQQAANRAVMPSSADLKWYEGKDKHLSLYTCCPLLC